MATQDRALFYVRTFPEGKNSQVLDLTSRVMTFEYLDHTTIADKLAITVDNHDLSNFDDPVWRKGMILSVSWGYRGNMVEARRCVIKKVKGGLKLTVEGHERTAAMHQVKKCRVWQGLTLQQMADQIQHEYKDILQWENTNKTNEKVHSIADELTIVHAVQAAESDAAFIAKMAKKFGMTFSLSPKGRVQFHEIDLKKPPVKTIVWRGGSGDWKNFNIDNDITGLVGAVTVKGVDTATKQKVEHRADNDSTKRDGLMSTVEVVDKRTLTASYQQRVASESVEHSGANEAGKSQIQAKAEGKYKASQRGTIKLEGTLIGDPLVRAKQILDVQGLGKRVSGRYRIIQARHHINEKGEYHVDFVAKSDGHGGYGHGVENTPSKADPNKEKALDAGGNKVQTVEIVNKRTLQAHYEFQKTREDQ
jgi:phage protein D